MKRKSSNGITETKKPTKEITHDENSNTKEVTKAENERTKKEIEGGTGPAGGSNAAINPKL
ncbi:protein of unknown function [Taphrina deformans PYCC 5710]|uniref:Uncharacterized protein n=1 Tax=Taphrina deformans (strain PYCC 5710 / ATCC 11124 / CBS 356.35 / IMI 108563 / JCM 9778 / NBRC 8474) TaxID=1097556 RepID=R4XB89_TAPDE|nr:protein of unknown function [Taphrina deformans PYCC 5710]|eukprot:CCG81607.1 protein of unknown function [Taphrina deformans PYCC 5710]